MNVILNNPINVVLSSGFLASEGNGVGTVQFRIEEQPIALVITTSDYTYDTPFSIGDRVKLIEGYGSFAVNSEGVIKDIIIDSTDDKASVLFDTVFPDQVYGPFDIEVVSSKITSLLVVPLRLLQII